MSESKVVAPPRRADFVPLSKVTNLQELFNHPEFKSRIAQAAPKHMQPERLLRTFVTAVQKTPKLMQVNPLSMIGACITLAALGLEPNTPLQHAHLIPFDVTKYNPGTREREYVRTDVQVIIGYSGYLDLIYRSDKIKDIECELIYKSDVDEKRFSAERGSNKHLRHTPLVGLRDPKDEIVGAYCYASLASGGEVFEIMSLADIHRIRARSQGFISAMYAHDDAVKKNKDPMKDPRYRDAPWIKDFEPMTRKTVLRAAQKWLPKSIEMSAAITIDGHAETGEIDFSKIMDAGQVMEGAYELTHDESVQAEVPAEREPEMAQSRSSQPAQTAQARPPAKTTPQPAQPVQAQPQAVEYPLYDAFGDVDEPPTGHRTDPAQFATAFASIYSKATPADQEALMEYNAETIAAAREASESAADILARAVAGPAQPQTEQHEEDRLYVPVKRSPAGGIDYRTWVQAAGDVIKGLPNVADLRGFETVNAEMIGKLGATFKQKFDQIFAARLNKLAPAPDDEIPAFEGPSAPAKDEHDIAADKLIADFQACRSVSELDELTRNGAIKAKGAALIAKKPELKAYIEDAIARRRGELLA